MINGVTIALLKPTDNEQLTNLVTGGKNRHYLKKVEKVSREQDYGVIGQQYQKKWTQRMSKKLTLEGAGESTLEKVARFTKSCHCKKGG